MDDRITIDVTMEIGQATESVQVTAEAPLLDTSTGSMGQVIDSRKVLELPLIAGNVTVMANLSPGVLFQPTFPKDVRPFDTGSGSAIAGDGTRVGNAQFQIDGAMNNANTGFAYSPPPGVVEEVKVQTASFDASSGFLTGVTVNMSLKSGTNQLHGQTYYFNQNPAVAATSFFFNRVGTPKLTYKAHRWGGNASGPVYLPKLYDGRNKTFWMYGYEGWWSFDPVSIGFEAVPTPAQRKGDFSGLLGLGSRYQIYDPYSIAPAAGRSVQPAAAAEQHNSRQPDRSARVQNRAALRSAEPARQRRWSQQLHQRPELARQLLQPHRPTRPSHIGQAALLRSGECNQELPRPGPAAQRYGRPHPVPLQSRRGDRSRLYRVSHVSHQLAIQLHPLHRRQLPRSERMGPGRSRFLLHLRQSDQGGRSAARCAFRRLPRPATRPCRSSRGTRIPWTRTTSR